MQRTSLGLATALVVAATAALVPLHHVAACSCAMGTEAQALANSVVAFEGVVADGPREMPPQEPVDFADVAFTFGVEEVLKGAPLPERLVISTSVDGASCGAGFAVGQRWRVYVSMLDDGRLYSGLCSNNQLLAQQAPIPTVVAPSTSGDGIPPGIWLGLAAAGAIALVSIFAFRRDGARR